MLLARKETGQGLVEYALILALIAIVVIVAVSLIGSDTNAKFSSIAGAI